jgi:hypothetical protein
MRSKKSPPLNNCFPLSGREEQLAGSLMGGEWREHRRDRRFNSLRLIPAQAHTDKDHGLLDEGSPLTFDRLFRAAHDRVRTSIAYRVTNVVDRENLSQEVWLRVHRNLDQFDPSRGSVFNWLSGVTTNVIRDHFRGNFSTLLGLRSRTKCALIMFGRALVNGRAGSHSL